MLKIFVMQKKLLLSKLFFLLFVFVAFTPNLDGGKYKYF